MSTQTSSQKSESATDKKSGVETSVHAKAETVSEQDKAGTGKSGDADGKVVPHAISFSDIESVDQLRDELNLQAHLLRSELKERFEKIEKEWPVLNVQIEPIRAATTQAGADVSAAVRLLFDTIRESYQDIKRSASTH